MPDNKRLKQLYNLALAKWQSIQVDITDLNDTQLYKRVMITCAFCRQCNVCCSYCKINKDICDRSASKGIISQFKDYERDNYDDVVDEMVEALQAEYDKL